MANKWAKQIENAKMVLADLEEQKKYLQQTALPIDGDDPADSIEHIDKVIKYYEGFIERRSKESN